VTSLSHKLGDEAFAFTDRFSHSMMVGGQPGNTNALRHGRWSAGERLRRRPLSTSLLSATPWRSLDGLDLPESAEAVRYAVTGGWMLVRDAHSVCLTDVGRRIVDSHSQM
jgi:hypothetical protein